MQDNASTEREGARQIAADDLEELFVLYQLLLVQSAETPRIWSLAQRLRQIINRTRGDFEE